MQSVEEKAKSIVAQYAADLRRYIESVPEQKYDFKALAAARAKSPGAANPALNKAMAAEWAKLAA